MKLIMLMSYIELTVGFEASEYFQPESDSFSVPPEREDLEVPGANGKVKVLRVQGQRVVIPQENLERPGEKYGQNIFFL